MEKQISDLNETLKAFGVGQQEILNHLEKVDREIAELKSLRNEESNVTDRPRTVAADQPPSVPQAPSQRSPSSPAGTAVHSLQLPVEHAGSVIPIQDEYQAIKDKLSGVKIPQELRVGTSRSGIRREDNIAANIVANSAKYVETTIKLLWNMHA